MTDDKIIVAAMRILRDRMTVGINLADPHDVVKHAATRLRDERREVMLAYWLDAGNRLLSVEEIASGSEAAVDFSLRDVARKGIAADAVGAYFCHNHPSGDPAASDADKAAAGRLNTMLAYVGVMALGHYTVTATAAENVLTGDRATFIEQAIAPNASRCPKCNHILEIPA